MAVKVLAAAGNEKVCSIASARSKSSWTSGLHAIGKCTSPKFSKAFARGGSSAIVAMHKHVISAARQSCDRSFQAPKEKRAVNKRLVLRMTIPLVSLLNTSKRRRHQQQLGHIHTTKVATEEL